MTWRGGVECCDVGDGTTSFVCIYLSMTHGKRHVERREDSNRE